MPNNYIILPILFFILIIPLLVEGVLMLLYPLSVLNADDYDIQLQAIKSFISGLFLIIFALVSLFVFWLILR